MFESVKIDLMILYELAEPIPINKDRCQPQSK
jgi:hypothetical protein